MQLNASSQRWSPMEACVKAVWLTPQEIRPEYLKEVQFLMQKRGVC